MNATGRFLDLIFCILLVFAAETLFSQGSTPGQIKREATVRPNPLNPNGDGWATESGGRFITNDWAESELPFVPLFNMGEPDADLTTGSGCGNRDLVDAETDKPYAGFLYYDPDGIPDNGNDMFMFRIRVASGISSGSFAYSVLLDLDLKFGATGPNADPTYIPDNPGFELEVRVRSGNSGSGIYIDNVDFGSQINLVTRSYLAFTQETIALHNDPDCSELPRFLDFVVLLSDMGLTSQDQFRIVAATSSSGNTVLGSNQADIGGIADGTYGDAEAAYDALINNFPGFNMGSGFVLPIELVSFEASLEGEVVLLSWQTATEINNQQFEIQRSLSDLESFETIAVKAGAGNSSNINNYSFHDLVADYNKDVIYYRLKQVDFDGSFSYSEIIAIEKLSQVSQSLEFFPNPVINHLVIRSEQVFNDGANLTIYNQLGTPVLDEQVGSVEPGIDRTIDLSSLEGGFYYLNVSDGAVTISERFIKN